MDTFHRPPVRTPDELLALWRTLMGPGGFDSRTLWVIFLDTDGHVQPVILPLEDVPAEPEVDDVRNLRELLARTLIDDLPAGATIALLLSRPGLPELTDSDRRWGRLLRAELADVTPWPVFLATRGSVRQFTPDDLVAV